MKSKVNQYINNTSLWHQQLRIILIISFTISPIHIMNLKYIYIYTNLNRCILLFLQRRLWLFSINKKVEVEMGACQGLSSTYRVIFGCWPTTDPRDTLAISSHSFHTRTHKTSVIDRNQSQKRKEQSQT